MRPQSLLIRDTRKLESAASPDPPSCHASVRPVYFSQYIDTLLLHPTIMPLLTSRRSLALAVTSLAFMAWMWHSAVASRVSPDGWNRGEYAGAEDVLSGWRAGVCRNVGVCGNWFGHGKGEQGTKLPSSLKRAPPYVLEYGTCARPPANTSLLIHRLQLPMSISTARKSLCPAILASSKPTAPPSEICHVGLTVGAGIA